METENEVQDRLVIDDLIVIDSMNKIYLGINDLYEFMTLEDISDEAKDKLHSEILFLESYLVSKVNKLNGKNIYVAVRDENEACSNPYPIATDEEEADLPIGEPWGKRKEYDEALEKAAGELEDTLKKEKIRKDEACQLIDSECSMRKQLADQKYEEISNAVTEAYKRKAEEAREEFYKR